MSDEREKRDQRIRDVYAEIGSILGTRRATGHSIGLIRKVLRREEGSPRERLRVGILTTLFVGTIAIIWLVFWAPLYLLMPLDRECLES